MEQPYNGIFEISDEILKEIVTVLTNKANSLKR